jgi:hypothetical protein
MAVLPERRRRGGGNRMIKTLRIRMRENDGNHCQFGPSLFGRARRVKMI